MNFYYGARSVVLYTHTSTTGERVVEVIYSEEGARMGCILGSLAFGITMMPVYETLGREFPELLSVAHTDDNPVGVPPPADGDWNRQLRCLHQRTQRYDELANPLGAFRNSCSRRAARATAKH
jgi:hypothetical protein